MAESPGARVLSANEALITEGGLDRIADFFSSEYVAHFTEQDWEGGHDAIRGFLTAQRAAFPDLRIEVEILVECGDRVAWQRTHRGTHQADFMGIPASGRALVWRNMVVTRFENGLIAEEWAISDLAERMIHE